MEEVPIVYGKDINTGAITQLKSIGNVLLTNSSSVALDNLTDVVITSASTGASLRYNGTNWVNSSGVLGDAVDVAITTPRLGDTLTYDGTNWVNRKKDYLSITMHGTSGSVSNPLGTGVYTFDTGFKRIITPNVSYWYTANSIIYVTQYVLNSGIVFNTSTGIISGLNSLKTYYVDITLNLNTYNIPTTTIWECRLTNGGSPTVTYATSKGGQVNDYGGITMSIKTHVTGTTTLTFENRASGISGGGLDISGTSDDTNLALYVKEI